MKSFLTVLASFAVFFALGIAGVAFGASLAGCSAAPPPAAQVARATAHAAVDIAKDAWVTVYDVAEQEKADGKEKIVPAMADDMILAHDLIIDAATAVDTNWSTEAGCTLLQATQLIAKSATLSSKLSVGGQAVVKDAADMAQNLLGGANCPGAGDAGKEAGK